MKNQNERFEKFCRDAADGKVHWSEMPIGSSASAQASEPPELRSQNHIADGRGRRPRPETARAYGRDDAAVISELLAEEESPAGREFPEYLPEPAENLDRWRVNLRTFVEQSQPRKPIFKAIDRFCNSYPLATRARAVAMDELGALVNKLCRTPGGLLVPRAL